MNPGLPQPGSVALGKSVLYSVPLWGAGQDGLYGCLSSDMCLQFCDMIQPLPTVFV